MEDFKGVLVAANEGLEALAMGELGVEHPAVGFDQAESLELSFVALIVERAEVPPVDFEALAGRGFHAHEGARGGTGRPHPPEVLAQETVTASVARRLETLQDDDAGSAGGPARADL